MRCLALYILISLWITGLARAQAPGTGAVAGEVTDPSGAVVASARVSIVSEGTNSSRIASTTPEGLFRVALLSPGNYSMFVVAPGFKREVLSSISVVVAETTVVNVELKIGTTPTEIEVKGSTELAQTESSALGRVTGEKTILALPLANRVAVREHNRWTAARITRSGSGTRSAVPMILDTKLM